MKRRSFISSLIGLFIAPKVVPKPKPVTKVYTDLSGTDVLTGYKGGDFFKTGIVYAPYMPLL